MLEQDGFMGENPGEHVLRTIREQQQEPAELGDYLSFFMAGRIKINPAEILASFKAKINFKERDGGLQILKDVIGLVRHLPGGGRETYDEKLAKERVKGRREAASYGTGEIDGKGVVLYGSHFDFFAGTLGAVAGEKFMSAANLAIKSKTALIAIFSSGGVRQQENFAGLLQMTRIVSAVSRFREKSINPYIAILLGQVWGGISASAVPLADVIVGVLGTDFGFAGRRVIETFTGSKVPDGAQTVESHFLHRNVDLILHPDGLYPWVRKLNHFISVKQNKKPVEAHESLPPVRDVGRFTDRILTEGFSTLSKEEIEKRGAVVNPTWDFSKKNLDDRHASLSKDPDRPDTETILAYGFENVVPLYSRLLHENTLLYPSIIAGLGSIDGIKFLVIGNQPSYQIRSDGSVKKIPASPLPEDYRYLHRMLNFGERAGLPVVFLTDTSGAKPTSQAEFEGQSDAIANAILRGISYKKPVIAIVTGILGSGGGLATTPFGDRVAMMENALACVAEPTSATSILYNKIKPTPEEITNTLNSMRATARDQKELGLIDDVIPEGDREGYSHARMMVEAIRNYVLLHTQALMLMPERKRLETRYKRIEKLEGVPLDRSA